MKIHEILKIDQNQYEQRLVIDKYVLWCDLNSHSNEDCQKLLANGAIFGWWLQEYRKLEDEFREQAAPYIGKADGKTLVQLYIENVIKIRDYRPQALIKTARKTDIVCQLN